MSNDASWEDRVEQATKTFTRFMPDTEPARLQTTLERRLGALGTFAFTAVGEMWDRPTLTRRDRSLLVIAVLAAQARDEELELHTTVGLRHGLTREEIEEINLHVAVYAGFPAAMAAQRRMNAALCEAEGVEHIEDRQPADHLSDAERLERGIDVWAKLTGAAAGTADPQASLRDLRGHVGELADWAMMWAFGEIWSRPQLSRRDRSLAVIAILTALGQASELNFHVRGGLNHGLSEAEVTEAMTHLCLYVGFPRAVTGMRTALEAISR